ncbi:hypothetical protein, partial [Paenibacillus xylanexedens]|uniref:hypothetical protein n=1 Tax=Paenibacillus xylanexedens TaxID=528191 RepID=UPI001C92F998
GRVGYMNKEENRWGEVNFESRGRYWVFIDKRFVVGFDELGLDLVDGMQGKRDKDEEGCWCNLG